MSPIERIALPFKKRNQREIAARAGGIATALHDAKRQDVTGPFQFGVGIAPLVLGPERYVTAINQRVAQALGEMGLHESFAYNDFMTKQLCSDSDVVSHDQWPSETKPHLSLAYSRIN